MCCYVPWKRAKKRLTEIVHLYINYEMHIAIRKFIIQLLNNKISNNTVLLRIMTKEFAVPLARTLGARKSSPVVPKWMDNA